MSIKLVCFDCGREFQQGDRIYEFGVGFVDDNISIIDEALEQWCEDCELKRAEK